MITVVTKENRNFLDHMVEQSFELRHRIFKVQRGWDVNSVDGKERDQFDDIHNVIYLLHTMPSGKVNGCARLIPTTGPNMIRDVFPETVDEGKMPNDPYIWESTRFAVEEGSKELGETKNVVTKRLMDAMIEVGMQFGMKEIVSVVDPITELMMKKKVGVPAGRLGGVIPFGVCDALSVHLDVSEATQKSLRAKSNFTTSQIVNAPWIEEAA